MVNNAKKDFGMIVNTFLKTTNFYDLYSWDVKAYTNKFINFNPSYKQVLFGDFLKKPKIEKIKIDNDIEYKILGVRSYGKGAFANRIVKGNTLKMREYYKAKPNHLFWCKVDTKNGAFGVITNDLSDGVASSNMTFAAIDTTKIDNDFLQILFTSYGVMSYLDSFVTGTTNRKYIRPEQLLREIKIPLPTLSEQKLIVNNYNHEIKEAQYAKERLRSLEKDKENYLFDKLGIERKKLQIKTKGLQAIDFNSLNEWGVDKIMSPITSTSKYNNIVSIQKDPELALEIFRGKSPKYSNSSRAFILNQKCNRWNEIDLRFIKSVDERWLKSIEEKFFTKPGDILINSTGEGTLGRASYISNEFEGLLYDSHILLLRLDKNIINPKLFVEIFNSSYCQDQVNEIKSAQATKQTELGVGNLMKIYFPLPASIEVQDSIVDYIQKIDEEISQLKIKSINCEAKARIDFEEKIFN